MIDVFDFGEGIKTKYIDFSFDEKSKIEDLIDNLKEDLIHVEYNNGCLLDVGWYPEFQLDGCFRIIVVRNYNWETPIFESVCDCLDSLVIELRKGVEKIQVFNS